MLKKNVFFLSLISILLWAFTWSQLKNTEAKTAVVPSAIVEEYPLPNGGAPRQIVQDNGDIWFTDPDANTIGRFVYTSTVDYAFTFYAIPTPDSEPYDLEIDGNVLWFTEMSGNNIGKLTIDTGLIEEFTVPTANSAPSGITVTPNGNVWFVQRDGNNLGKFDPQTNIFEEYLYPRSNALLEDLDSAIGGDLIWFTAPGVKRLGWFTIASSAFLDVPTANFNTPPYTPSQLVIGSQNDAWVSTREGIIGRLSPGTVQFFRWYQVAPGTANLDGMSLKSQGSDRQVWFTDSTSGLAGQLLTESDGPIINKWVFPIAIPDGELYGITAMDNDTVWLADYGNNRLLRWSPPYFLSVYLPVINN